jgi:hypothetical protein
VGGADNPLIPREEGVISRITIIAVVQGEDMLPCHHNQWE